MQKIFFRKMSGAGNDFIVIDKNSYLDLVLTNDVITKLCDRHNGIGADGIITISGSDHLDFEMDYYNADGSTGSLCGNGSRCAVSFAADKFSLEGKVNFLSNGTKYTGEVLSGGKIRFFFNEPRELRHNLKLKAADQLINADFIDTGSPHVVIEISGIAKRSSDSFYTEISELPVNLFGKEIRNLPEFAPGGTNVNFIDIKEGKLFIRTYERGVENETLSCGTGSAASAIIAFFKNKIKPPVSLISRGGDELIVNFKFEDEKIKELSLTGPVLNTFAGEFLLNQYL